LAIMVAIILPDDP